MPDLIENNISVFDEIIKIFNAEVKDNLEHEAKELKKRLQGVIDRNAGTYILETQNDVNPIKYYSLKHRIKGVVSLKEKLVRKNDGFKILAASEISELKQVEGKKASIISQLNKVPDIIGIRVVTELRHDCKKVLALLRAFVDDLAAIEIVLDKVDLESQPQPMKNGLTIFKIKGLFRTNYGFELQIKSKIEEAWGDMDHAIFYKDYSVTPVKNITQVTMNNVGKLLEDIDELLLGLRNSENQYQENLEQLNNLKLLNDELYPLILDKLGIGFEIGKIASFLTFMKEKANENVEVVTSLTSLDCSFLEFPLTSERHVLYAAIRAESFELMIIELAFFNWCKQNGKIILTEANYEANLETFLDLLANHIYKVIEQENSAQAAELESVQNLSLKIMTYSKYIKSHDIYLSEETLLHISKVEGNIEEFFQEKNEAYFSEEEDYLQVKAAFKIAYVIKSLGFNDSQAIEDLMTQFNHKESLINGTLESIAYDFKEYQRKNERNARADQRKGEIVKESVPSISVTESIVTNLKVKLNAE